MEVLVRAKENPHGVFVRLYDEAKKAFSFRHMRYENFFYVKTDDYDRWEDDFLSQFKERVGTVEYHGAYAKIPLRDNTERNLIKWFWENNQVKTYEADLTAHKRFIVDKKVIFSQEKLPYAFFDIETDDRGALITDDMGRVVAGDARILSFSIGTEAEGYSTVSLGLYDNDAEIALLTLLMQEIARYGIVVGYNSEKFDWPFIRQRCFALGVSTTAMDYVNHLDYYMLVTKYANEPLPSHTLEYVSQHYLGQGKVEQEKGNGAIYDTWVNEREHLRQYNQEDARLLELLNKKQRFVGLVCRIANIAGCHPEDVLYNSRSVDVMLLRRYHSRGLVCASKPNEREREEREEFDKISGGFTRCFKPGFHKTVHTNDFESFYPSVIMTFNVSPETYVATVTDISSIGMEYIVTPSNLNEEDGTTHWHRVYRKEKGVVPEVCEELRGKRKDVRAQQKLLDKGSDDWWELELTQLAYKILNNSIYGVISSKNTRYYIFDLGDTVTTSCQAIIKECYKFLTHYGCVVLGGDTDSTFYTMPDCLDVETCDGWIAKDIGFYMTQWHLPNDRHHIRFVHEKVMKNMLFVMKKNYAYLDEKGVVKITGLECKKTDSNRVGGTLQREFIDDILFERYSEELWREKVKTMRNRILDRKLSIDEVTMVKTLKKSPKEYEGYIVDSKTGKPKVKKDGTLQAKSVPAHVKLALEMAARGKQVQVGNKIKFVITSEKPNVAKTPEDGYADYDTGYYWKRAVKPLLKVVSAYHGKIPEWDWELPAKELAVADDDDD